MKQWTSAVLIVACTRLLLNAQVGVSEPIAGVTLAGSVVADATGQPLAGVHVSLRTVSGTPPVTTLSDAVGRFTLSVPVAGSYQLTARKAGFTLRSASAVPGTATLLRLGQRAVLTGRVTDEVGEPVIGAMVAAIHPDGGPSVAAATDDRGDYRLSATPGQPLLLSVSTMGIEPGSTSRRSFGPLAPYVVYFPGTTQAERAMRLQMQPGELRSSMDLVVPTEQSMRQPYRGLDSIALLQAHVEAGGPSDAQGVLVGRVADTASRGLANALVVMVNERGGTGLRMTRSDAGGRFEFRQVPPGSFRVAASMPGYAAADARPTLSESQTKPVEVSLRLTKLGSISGRVVNEFGEPMEHARVQVMAIRYARGRRTPVFVASDDPLTDDRGMYRVHGLEPGTYVVSAELADEAAEQAGYRRSFFGSAGPADATLLTLTAGQESGDTDVQLSRWSTYRVTGRVLDAAGQPKSTGGVTLLPSYRSSGVVSVPVSAQIAVDGRFEFKDVSSGEYVVQAYRGRVDTTTEGEFGAVRVTVGGNDVTDVVLKTEMGSSISGVVLLDSIGSTIDPDRAGIELTPVPSDFDLSPNNWPTAGITSEWRFAFAGISGPRRLIPTRLPEGWGVKEIRVNGIDVGDRPLPFGAANQSVTDVEVVLTDRPSQLRGLIVDARGQGVGGVPVAIFSPERDRWYQSSPYLQRVTTKADGSFGVTGMPPSGYYVAVMPQPVSEDGAWQDPASLEALISNSSFVMLAEAQRTTVQLRR